MTLVRVRPFSGSTRNTGARHQWCLLHHFIPLARPLALIGNVANGEHAEEIGGLPPVDDDLAARCPRRHERNVKLDDRRFHRLGHGLQRVPRALPIRLVLPRLKLLKGPVGSCELFSDEPARVD